MGDSIPIPIYDNFTIVSTTNACLQVPVTPKKDACQIRVDEVESNLSFVLNRKDNRFQPAPADARKVVKAYPRYRAPKELADYLLLKGKIFEVLGEEKKPKKVLGEEKKPSEVFLDSINLGTSETIKNDQEKREAIFGWMNFLCNFISHGQLDPKNPRMRELMELTIQSVVFSFADPTLGTRMQNVLTEVMKDDTTAPQLDPESHERLKWLLAVFDARKKLWDNIQEVMNKSGSLITPLRKLSVDFLVFMFANYIPSVPSGSIPPPSPGKNSNDYLFSENTKKMAATFHQVFSSTDPKYKASDNFYAFIKSTMSALKTVAVPEKYRKDFLDRVSFIETEYEGAADTEMRNILSNKPADAALAEYLRIKYGNTEARAQVLDFILKNMAEKTINGSTSYSFAMEKIRQDLEAWGNAKPPDQKKEAREAVLYLLKTFFEKGGKIEVFWDKKIQTDADNFYKNLPLTGSDKTALDNLILWARPPAEVPKPPPILSKKPYVSEKPSVELWQPLLKTELGVGISGIVGATAVQFSIQDSSPRYYVVGGLATVGASALGATGGHLLSYKLHASRQRAWLFDVGGAVLGGILGGLIYNLTAKSDMSGSNVKNPVDCYPIQDCPHR